MKQQKQDLRLVSDAFIDAAKAFDVERVLALFASNAIIDDPSTGHKFNGHQGIRRYIKNYFVGYNTVTRLLSIKMLSNHCARVRVDFTGDFGHEIGLLEISINNDKLIVRIDAELE